MKKKYYKLTTEINGKQFSYATLTGIGLAEVEYSADKWTRAPEWLAKKGYHLFVFDDLQKALKFAYMSSPPIRLWECEIRSKYKNLPVYISRDEINNGRLVPVNGRFPEGTVMAREVKLIKKIWG